MTSTPRARFRRLIVAAGPALLLGLFLVAEVSAQPPPHAPGHVWRGQEAQMPGPPSHAPAYGWRGQEEHRPGPPPQAPAYGWRGQQGQMPAPPPHGGPRDPRAEQRPSPWGPPGVPDYRGDREPVWQHDPRREAERWRGQGDDRPGARDTRRPRDDSRDFPRYDRHQWDDEGRWGDRRLRGSEREAEDMHQWQDAEQRRERRGDTQREH
nr:hypothetical protein [Thioalkalivibrio sp.]